MILHWHIKMFDGVDVPPRIIPVQLVLYLFIWFGGLHTMVTPSNALIGFEVIGPVIDHAWNVLVLGSPIIVGIAWMLIHHRRGQFRVWGFWLRLGGDVGMMSALLTFIVTRIMVLESPPGDSPLFALIVVSGVMAVSVSYVVRDVTALVLMERWAHWLHTEAIEHGSL